MSEGKQKHLNKSHPDCSEYTRRFHELWEGYSKLQKDEESKYPDWRGKDHPADEVLRPAFRKLSEDIKALQKEYSYLFIEE